VVGAGAVGSLLGYFIFSSTREPVRFIVRREEHARRISSGGVSLRGLIDYRYPAEAYTRPRAGDCDAALVAVKAYDVEEAYGAAVEATGGGLVVIVSNGMGLGVEGRSGIAFGVADYGATRVEDGLVEVRGLGSLTIGPADALRGYEWLPELLSRGGCNVRVVGDVEPYRWLKLALNASVNPVTALLGARNRVVVESRSLWSLVEGVVAEVERVAAGRGVGMPGDPLEYVRRVVSATGENCSSMLQDVIAGRRTEVDYLNGFVAREARLQGVPAPINETLYLLVKALEESMVPGVGEGHGKGYC
jgi:2-dehydropantoate 2-reductase